MFFLISRRHSAINCMQASQGAVHIYWSISNSVPMVSGGACRSAARPLLERKHCMRMYNIDNFVRGGLQCLINDNIINNIDGAASIHAQRLINN